MEQGRLAFTAVYLKSNHGYIGFIEELPGVNSHGRTLDEARETLQKLAAVVFDEERREAEEMIAGKDVVRENFVVPIPRSPVFIRAPRALPFCALHFLPYALSASIGMRAPQPLAPPQPQSPSLVLPSITISSFTL